MPTRCRFITPFVNSFAVPDWRCRFVRGCAAGYVCCRIFARAANAVRLLQFARHSHGSFHNCPVVTHDTRYCYLSRYAHFLLLSTATPRHVTHLPATFIHLRCDVAHVAAAQPHVTPTRPFFLPWCRFAAFTRTTRRAALPLPPFTIPQRCRSR